VLALATRRRSAQHGYAFRLASLATLGFILELLVVEKQLFASGKYEVGAAVDAGEYFILKFH
jgi:hypothetical protein